MRLREWQTRIQSFDRERGWDYFHPLELYVNINEELGEIWQKMAWVDDATKQARIAQHRDAVEQDLGDVLRMVLMLANQFGVDAERGLERALALHGGKFPPTHSEAHGHSEARAQSEAARAQRSARADRAERRRDRSVIDLQVNGALGVDFAAPDLDAHGIERACAHHRERGTRGLLATLVTAPDAVYARNLPLLAERVEAHARVGGPLLGVHLEGPYLSPAPGAIGAHDPRLVRAPDPDHLARLQDLARGTLRLITLAAELPGAEATIRRARALGITVSLGHQLADADALRRAVDAGATALTHFGNGVPNTLPRHDNPLWAGLAEDGLAVMLVADGHHVPPAFLKTVLRVKGPSRVILTSDAAPLAGCAPGPHRAFGRGVVLEPDGRLHDPERGCLAGSSATLSDCVAHLASLGLLGDDELAAAAHGNPLALLGLPAAP